MLSAVPINGETWLICGGREFSDRNMFDCAMSTLLGARGCPAKVVHGAARGADTLAGEWADRHAVDVVACPADWKANGRAAGPIRNSEMLRDHRPDLVIAFPGGRGTADMVAKAEKAGISVANVITPTPPEG